MSDTPKTVKELIEETEEWGPLPFSIKNRLFELERELASAKKDAALYQWVIKNADPEHLGIDYPVNWNFMGDEIYKKQIDEAIAKKLGQLLPA